MGYKNIRCPHLNSEVKEFIVDTDADFEKLPPACTGSTAVSIESAKVMVVNTEGKWVVFGEPSGGGSDSIVGTWQFNDELNFDGLTVDKEYLANFTYVNGGGETCERVGFKYFERNNGVYALGYGAVYGGGEGVNFDVVYQTDALWGQPKGWTNESDKTITFAEEPSAEVGAWVRANGKKIA